MHAIHKHSGLTADLAAAADLLAMMLQLISASRGERCQDLHQRSTGRLRQGDWVMTVFTPCDPAVYVVDERSFLEENFCTHEDLWEKIAFVGHGASGLVY